MQRFLEKYRIGGLYPVRDGANAPGLAVNNAKIILTSVVTYRRNSLRRNENL